MPAGGLCILKRRTNSSPFSPQKHTTQITTNCFVDFMGDPNQSFDPTKAPTSQTQNNLADTIRDELSESAQKIYESLFPARIYRVPKDFREFNKSAYIPRIISIGPLHCKEADLQTRMQDVKKHYAYCLFSRLTEGMNNDYQKCEKKTKVLLECVEKMQLCVDRAKKYYAEELNLDDADMVKMMLVDGCFILELLYASYHTNKSKAAEEKTTNGRDSGNPKASSSVQKPIDGGEDGSKSSSGGELPRADPVIDNILTANMIKQDLILLENQIPFFVLEELFKLIVDKIPEKNKLPLTEYVLKYFDNIWRPNDETRSSKTKTSCCLPDECVLCVNEENEKGEKESRKANVYYHILHFLHEHYHQVQTKRKDSTKFSEFKVSAADLHNAGVEFLNHPSDVYVKEPKGIYSCFFGVRFNIPSLLIHERTEVFLRNLIALEQCCPKIPRKFTSYAKVMNMLINSEKDVQVLKDAGIIHNYLGTDKDVPDLFDKLCKGVTVPEDLYLDACQQAIEYYKRRYCLPMTMRYWTRLIFTSTWGVVAFALGIITSLITVAQFVRDFRK